jgi:Domain of unknown function (DUF4160)
LAQVKAFRIAGIQCWFYSNDHRPPHFHAKRRGEWEARVYFLEAGESLFEMLAWSGPMSRQDSERIAQKVDAHRDALLAEWEQIQGASE